LWCLSSVFTVLDNRQLQKNRLTPCIYAALLRDEFDSVYSPPNNARVNEG